MKKQPSKRQAQSERLEIPVQVNLSVNPKPRSRRPFRFIGDATTKDGTEYRLGIHRTHSFPVLLHVESDTLIELTWDALVTLTHDSQLHRLPSGS
ncbi:MAG TPA: hypothetical protein PLA50_05090 [Bacteroidia bacterium]|nr:hypothetical protein [Bacteroidia bacterium]